ncbi:NADH:ubiquinone oxidoreductase subunit NDUFA12 [Brevundimonas naejangsanensis]|nr:NADH:ubiquinone oxidoreductase subunit NDUFA12 [Brevundimonas naejangsanensis]
MRSTLDVRRRGFYDRPAPPDLPGAVDSSEFNDVLSKIFTWWNGATIGTLFTIGKRGQQVGTDEFGNRYYESRDTVSYDGRKRRWVIYDGYAEATKVPPEWQGWLRYTYDETPAERPLPRQAWEKDHLPNMTGTPMARRPQGSLAALGQRPAATGDYQAWSPE